jgi:hypothetical protein
MFILSRFLLPTRSHPLFCSALAHIEKNARIMRHERRWWEAGLLLCNTALGQSDPLFPSAVNTQLPTPDVYRVKLLCCDSLLGLVARRSAQQVSNQSVEMLLQTYAETLKLSSTLEAKDDAFQTVLKDHRSRLQVRVAEVLIRRKNWQQAKQVIQGADSAKLDVEVGTHTLEIVKQLEFKSRLARTKFDLAVLEASMSSTVDNSEVALEECLSIDSELIRECGIVTSDLNALVETFVWYINRGLVNGVATLTGAIFGELPAIVTGEESSVFSELALELEFFLLKHAVKNALPSALEQLISRLRNDSVDLHPLALFDAESHHSISEADSNDLRLWQHALLYLQLATNAAIEDVEKTRKEAAPQVRWALAGKAALLSQRVANAVGSPKSQAGGVLLASPSKKTPRAYLPESVNLTRRRMNFFAVDGSTMKTDAVAGPPQKLDGRGIVVQSLKTKRECLLADQILIATTQLMQSRAQGYRHMLQGAHAKSSAVNYARHWAQNYMDFFGDILKQINVIAQEVVEGDDMDRILSRASPAFVTYAHFWESLRRFLVSKESTPTEEAQMEHEEDSVFSLLLDAATPDTLLLLGQLLYARFESVHKKSPSAPLPAGKVSQAIECLEKLLRAPALSTEQEKRRSRLIADLLLFGISASRRRSISGRSASPRGSNKPQSPRRSGSSSSAPNESGDEVSADEAGDDEHYPDDEDIESLEESFEDDKYESDEASDDELIAKHASTLTPAKRSLFNTIQRRTSPAPLSQRRSSPSPSPSRRSNLSSSPGPGTRSNTSAPAPPLPQISIDNVPTRQSRLSELGKLRAQTQQFMQAKNAIPSSASTNAPQIHLNQTSGPANHPAATAGPSPNIPADSGASSNASIGDIVAPKPASAAAMPFGSSPASIPGSAAPAGATKEDKAVAPFNFAVPADAKKEDKPPGPFGFAATAPVVSSGFGVGNTDAAKSEKPATPFGFGSVPTEAKKEETPAKPFGLSTTPADVKKEVTPTTPVGFGGTPSASSGQKPAMPFGSIAAPNVKPQENLATSFGFGPTRVETNAVENPSDGKKEHKPAAPFGLGTLTATPFGFGATAKKEEKPVTPIASPSDETKKEQKPAEGAPKENQSAASFGFGATSATPSGTNKGENHAGLSAPSVDAKKVEKPPTPFGLSAAAALPVETQEEGQKSFGFGARPDAKKENEPGIAPGPVGSGSVSLSSPAAATKETGNPLVTASLATPFSGSFAFGSSPFGAPAKGSPATFVVPTIAPSGLKPAEPVSPIKLEARPTSFLNFANSGTALDSKQIGTAPSETTATTEQKQDENRAAPSERKEKPLTTFGFGKAPAEVQTQEKHGTPFGFGGAGPAETKTQDGADAIKPAAPSGFSATPAATPLGFSDAPVKKEEGPSVPFGQDTARADAKKEAEPIAAKTVEKPTTPFGSGTTPTTMPFGFSAVPADAMKGVKPEASFGFAATPATKEATTFGFGMAPVNEVDKPPAASFGFGSTPSDAQEDHESVSVANAKSEDKAATSFGFGATNSATAETNEEKEPGISFGFGSAPSGTRKVVTTLRVRATPAAPAEPITESVSSESGASFSFGVTSNVKTDGKLTNSRENETLAEAEEETVPTFKFGAAPAHPKPEETLSNAEKEATSIATSLSGVTSPVKSEEPTESHEQDGSADAKQEGTPAPTFSFGASPNPIKVEDRAIQIHEDKPAGEETPAAPFSFGVAPPSKMQDEPAETREAHKPADTKQEEAHVAPFSFGVVPTAVVEDTSKKTQEDDAKLEGQPASTFSFGAATGDNTAAMFSSRAPPAEKNDQPASVTPSQADLGAPSGFSFSGSFDASKSSVLSETTFSSGEGIKSPPASAFTPVPNLSAAENVSLDASSISFGVPPAKQDQSAPTDNAQDQPVLGFAFSRSFDASKSTVLSQVAFGPSGDLKPPSASTLVVGVPNLAEAAKATNDMPAFSFGSSTSTPLPSAVQRDDSQPAEAPPVVVEPVAHSTGFSFSSSFDASKSSLMKDVAFSSGSDLKLPDSVDIKPVPKLSDAETQPINVSAISFGLPAALEAVSEVSESPTSVSQAEPIKTENAALSVFQPESGSDTDSTDEGAHAQEDAAESSFVREEVGSESEEVDSSVPESDTHQPVETPESSGSDTDTEGLDVQEDVAQDDEVSANTPTSQQTQDSKSKEVTKSSAFGGGFGVPATPFTTPFGSSTTSFSTPFGQSSSKLNETTTDAKSTDNTGPVDSKVALPFGKPTPATPSTFAFSTPSGQSSSVGDASIAEKIDATTNSASVPLKFATFAKDDKPAVAAPLALGTGFGIGSAAPSKPFSFATTLPPKSPAPVDQKPASSSFSFPSFASAISTSKTAGVAPTEAKDQTPVAELQSKPKEGFSSARTPPAEPQSKHQEGFPSTTSTVTLGAPAKVEGFGLSAFSAALPSTPTSAPPASVLGSKPRETAKDSSSESDSDDASESDDEDVAPKQLNLPAPKPGSFAFGKAPATPTSPASTFKPSSFGGLNAGASAASPTSFSFQSNSGQGGSAFSATPSSGGVNAFSAVPASGGVNAFSSPPAATGGFGASAFGQASRLGGVSPAFAKASLIAPSGVFGSSSTKTSFASVAGPKSADSEESDGNSSSDE